MSSGKVCASVSAETCAEAVEKIGLAARSADIIEIRFDHLRPDELPLMLGYLRSHTIIKPIIATYRAPEQGGRGPVSAAERRGFWKMLGDCVESVDLEEDVFDTPGKWETRILSYHNFSFVDGDPNAIFNRLNARRPDIIKYAYLADDIIDTLPVWNLLQKAERVSQPVVAIAMGEAGKITRILGPPHGSRWTYGSVGEATAPGQISADDLTNLYRIREIDRETRVYGVIGDPVSQSLSPHIHNAAFANAGVNSVFLPLLVKDIGQFIDRMVRPDTREVDLNFGGFAVTMPHKLSIIDHLDEIDETAKAIGAVNTVLIDGGRLHGYNTDAEGFVRPLSTRYGPLKGARAAIYGAGGAARACVFSLKKEGAIVTVFARDPSKAEKLATEFGVNFDTMDTESAGAYDIVINATPIGMNAASDTGPLAPDLLEHAKLVYDLVTSSVPTPLIQAAENAGLETITGVEMLVAQAVRQFEIWTGETAPAAIMMKAAEMSRLSYDG